MQVTKEEKKDGTVDELGPVCLSVPIAEEEEEEAIPLLLQQYLNGARSRRWIDGA